MSSPSERNETADTALRVFRELKENVITKQQARLLLEEMGLQTVAATLADPVKAA